MSRRRLRSPGAVARGMWRRLGGVRVRLTLWYLLILAVVFLVFGALLFNETLQRTTIEERSALITLAQQVSATYSPTDGRLHLENLPSPVGDRITTSKNHTDVAKVTSYFAPTDIVLLLSPQGQIIQESGPVTQGTLDALAKYISSPQVTSDLSARGAFRPLKLPISGHSVSNTVDYVLFSVPIMSKGTRVATLLLGRVNGFDQVTQTVAPGLLLAGPLTLLIAALGGYWLASRAMSPIRKITRTAQALSASDLSQRLNLKRQDELGELATTFDGMLDRLEAAFTRQRQFTADASHELRTPLTIVDLEVTHALAAPRSPAEYARALTIVQAENAAMARLVNDLLLLARADAATEPLQRQPLDLSDVALDTVERLAPLARQLGITLATGALPEVVVNADRAHLSRTLTNLVENGIIYTAGVGRRVVVATGVASRDGRQWGWARVEDDGPGVPTESLPHLFERFYRVDAARAQPETTPERGGSGLGLAIVQWVAQAHGGEAHAESAPGLGATFELWLPLDR